MRNHGISIIVLDKNDYHENFKPLINNITLSSYREIVKKMQKMKEDKNDITVDGKKINFNDLYELDSLENLEKQVFLEVSEKYMDCKNNDTLRSQLDIDVLQSMLFYTASKHFKGKFYLDLAYHPPIELSSIFTPFFREYGAAKPTLIDFINPYEPMLESLDEKGGIYYVSLKHELIRDMQKALEVNKQSLKESHEIGKDLFFLNDIFESALSGESLILIRVMP